MIRHHPCQLVTVSLAGWRVAQPSSCRTHKSQAVGVHCRNRLCIQEAVAAAAVACPSTTNLMRNLSVMRPHRIGSRLHHSTRAHEGTRRSRTVLTQDLIYGQAQEVLSIRGGIATTTTAGLAKDGQGAVAGMVLAMTRAITVSPLEPMVDGLAAQLQFKEVCVAGPMAAGRQPQTSAAVGSRGVSRRVSVGASKGRLAMHGGVREGPRIQRLQQQRTDQQELEGARPAGGKRREAGSAKASAAGSSRGGRNPSRESRSGYGRQRSTCVPSGYLHTATVLMPAAVRPLPRLRELQCALGGYCTGNQPASRMTLQKRERTCPKRLRSSAPSPCASRALFLQAARSLWS
mmetsp:Transcript_24214/g.66592  ORF Transcript_24214/g.66592 Transcript_24214/m.66592 type:complete len:346 (+) Transcript_24214:170-1207(+)